MISRGLMAYLASKEKGDYSMPSKPSLVPRRTGRGDDGPCLIWRKLNCLKTNLQMAQSDARWKDACNRCQPLRQGVQVPAAILRGWSDAQ